MAEHVDTNILTFKPRGKTQVMPEPVLAEFSSGFAERKGSDLVTHPLGINGGFVDTAIDLVDVGRRRALIKGAAEGLIFQTVPDLARRANDDEKRKMRIEKEEGYLAEVIKFRNRTDVRPIPPMDPKDIKSYGSLNIGETIDTLEAMVHHTNEEREKYAIANANSSALKILGFEDGSENLALFHECAQKELDYINGALADRKAVNKALTRASFTVIK